MNKILILITLATLTSCTKNPPTPPNQTQSTVRALLKLIDNDHDPNVTSLMTKGDSTTRGGWVFQYDHFLDSMPNSTNFQFYVTTPQNNPDNITGTMDFTTTLSGIHLTDSVVDHNTLYYYIYSGTGKWKLQSQTGDLQHYFKTTASGTLTYQYIQYAKDSDGVPYDNAEYHATLDGTGD